MKRGYCWHPVLLRLQVNKPKSTSVWPKGWRCTNCKRIYLLRRPSPAKEQTP